MYFGNSTFLWAFMLLAIPIIVHLVRLRKLKIIKFSSFKFLRKTAEQGAKPKKLLRYLILASRCFAFSCLIFAFAMPSYNQQYVKASKTIVGIYFDNSLSMAGLESDPLVFSKHKEHVRKIIRNLSQSAEIKLITQSSFGGASNSLSVSQAEEALDRVKPSNLSQPMSVLLKRLIFSMDKESGATKDIYIVSDFQKGSLGHLKGLDIKGKNVHAFYTPLQNMKNLSIDTAWIKSPVLLKGEPVTIEFSVQNNLNEDANNIPIKLVNKNVQLGMISLSIPAKSKRSSSFMVAYKSGFEDLYISLNDNGFSFDNVLFVNPGEAPVMKIKHVGVPNKYVTQVLVNQDVFKPVNQDADRMVCAECSRTEFTQRIVPFVQEGGVALVSLSSENTGSEMAQFLGVKELKLRTGTFSISNKSLTHPFFGAVFKSTPENMSLPPVFSYYSTGGNTGYAEPILSLNNGDAFFMKINKGKGQLYLVMAPMNRTSSSWVESSLFLPTLTQALLPSAGCVAVYGLLSETSPVGLHVAIENNEKEYLLRGNGSESQASISKGNQRAALHVSQYVHEPGTYELLDKENNRVLDRVALNISRSESETASESREVISAQIPSLNWLRTDSETSEFTSKSVSKKSGGLWRLFIWLAAAFFVIEMVLVLVKQNPKFLKTDS
ncbi:MAG: BatA domain-containing protein [Bacteroidia bacterium]|nr:BatA domain-containing protein [Bacteroidia bacterium]